MAEGEFDLIAQLAEKLPSSGERLRVGSGDDAAVTEPTGAAAATTIDSLVEGVHFTLPEFPLRAVGRKALAAALSDLAAMGARPGEAYVALGVPESLDRAGMIELASGLGEVAEREGVAVAGGDVTRAPVLSLTVACVGYEAPGAALVTRSGARPGQAVALTGELGAAAAALAALGIGSRAGPTGATGPDQELLSRQFDPQPRLAAGRALAEKGAMAMIDISDGLGADAAHLASASGARLELELSLIPVSGAAQGAVGGEHATELALSGGEDYELLVALPPEALKAAAAAVSATGTSLTRIGRVVEGEGVLITDERGEPVEAGGFDHMRGSSGG